ncbi:putative choline-phosphate cytidylyltransferase [Teratosphaeria destructans]|uniref:choline-phosphate cytidylyltransferase n=1 Tax=Teratosphaeria destructans TaxID=418781 RepID=A0A9W7W3E3_9PEZI|nr:putative choline-phosphate cytidylyltransferase [Teratosphaeria destructans]
MPPKRKRAGTTSKEAEPSIQPATHDASAEDPVDTGAEDVKERKTMDPPSKRTRGSVVAHPGEETTASPTKAAGRARAASVAEMPADGLPNGAGENGEAGTMRMPPPPKAGSVDPVGYKTNPPPEGRPVRVYADGVFDMFHLGHMRVLQQAKMAFPDTYLIVGVTGDTETHKRKGLTVMCGKERAESLRHCRWVDEVIEDCPWIITVEFLEKHEIDYVAHDDLPYGASEGDDIYKPIKEKGMFLVTQRTEGVSTTGIITKIIRDYEQYISRQLKRGSSRQELNISWLKKNELDIKRHVAELRDNIRQNWTTTGQEVSKELQKFWQSASSRPSSPAPSRSGSIRQANGAKSPLGSIRDGTPGREGKKNLNDFAAGYAMGLIGGVKGWMEGSRRRNLSEASRPPSPGNSDGEKSPVEEGSADRRGRPLEQVGAAQDRPGGPSKVEH